MNWLIIDIETTGLPDKPPGWQPRVVEIGVAHVVEGKLLSTDAVVVRQPPEHVASPEAHDALAISGLTPEQIARDGVSPKHSAIWLASHALPRPVARAFNQQFDFAFLDQEPWNLLTLIDKGECIMLEAMSVMGPAGALPPAPDWVKKRDPMQQWKWPRASEAVAYFNGRGHNLRYDKPAHRAEQDAALEALLAIAIAKEKNG